MRVVTTPEKTPVVGMGMDMDTQLTYVCAGLDLCAYTTPLVTGETRGAILDLMERCLVRELSPTGMLEGAVSPVLATLKHACTALGAQQAGDTMAFALSQQRAWDLVPHLMGVSSPEAALIHVLLSLLAVDSVPHKAYLHTMAARNIMSQLLGRKAYHALLPSTKHATKHTTEHATEATVPSVRSTSGQVVLAMWAVGSPLLKDMAFTAYVKDVSSARRDLDPYAIRFFAAHAEDAQGARRYISHLLVGLFGGDSNVDLSGWNPCSLRQAQGAPSRCSLFAVLDAVEYLSMYRTRPLPSPLPLKPELAVPDIVLDMVWFLVTGSEDEALDCVEPLLEDMHQTLDRSAGSSSSPDVLSKLSLGAALLAWISVTYAPTRHPSLPSLTSSLCLFLPDLSCFKTISALYVILRHAL